MSALARAWLAGRPSAARARTGTRLTSAVTHEWQSDSTVDGTGRPSPYHPQSLVLVSQISRAVSVRLGPRPGSCPGGRSESQWAVLGTCWNWVQAGWCRRLRVAVSCDRHWGQAAQARTTLCPQSPSVGPDVPAPSDSGHGRLTAGRCVFGRTPGRNRCNVQIGNGSPFGKL